MNLQIKQTCNRLYIIILCPKLEMQNTNPFWKDKYLKWICGFANAQGGTLYIGKDDNGNVVGVKDAKKLL